MENICRLDFTSKCHPTYKTQIHACNIMQMLNEIKPVAAAKL